MPDGASWSAGAAWLSVGERIYGGVREASPILAMDSFWQPAVHHDLHHPADRASAIPPHRRGGRGYRTLPQGSQQVSAGRAGFPGSRHGRRSSDRAPQSQRVTRFGWYRVGTAAGRVFWAVVWAERMGKAGSY